MGKASITISVGALWNGSSQLDKVVSDLSKMEKLAARNVNSTTKSLADSGAQWSKLGDSIYEVGSKIANLGDTLTAKVTQPMAALGGYCVEQAVTFDTALANLNKTADLTAEQLEEFGDAALEASKTSPVTADEILNAEALGAQLGISADSLQDFADVANGLNIATNLDMETAGTNMSQFARITGMAEDELSNYGSTIVDLGNNLATTESDISNMSLRLAGVSTIANFTSADILGISGAMSSLGINAEAGGTAMTNIINTISVAVSEGGEQLETYADIAGVSADEFASMWSDQPVQALELLVEGTHDAVQSGEDMNTVLGDLGISGIRQSDVWRRLAGSGDGLREAVDLANTAWEENTALSTEVNKRNESLESRFQTLQNKVNAAATEVGEVLAEKLLAAADALSPLIDGIGDAATAFNNLNPSTQTAITALAGIVTAAGPVLSVTGRIVQAIGDVSSKIGETKQTFAVFGDALDTVDGSQMRVYASSDSLASKLGLAGNAASKAAGGADNYVKAWETMTDSAKTYQDKQDKLVTVLNKIPDASDKAKESLMKQADTLKNQASAAKSSYEENAKLVTKWSQSTDEAAKAAKGVDGLEDSLERVTESQQEFVKETGNVNTGLSGMTSHVGGVASSITTMIGGFAKAAAATAAIAALSAVIGIVVEKVIEWKEHQDLLEGATESFSDIMGDAASGAEGLGDAIGGIEPDVEGVLQDLEDLNESVKDTFTDVTVSSAKLDQYTSVIDDLANKSNLSATEQWKLEQAVEGYNEVCGTAYTVTDKTNGVIADGNGVIQTNTDQIKANADAWKKRAEAEAYQNVATQYFEAQIKAEQELAIATSNLNAAKQRQSELSDIVNGKTGASTEEVRNAAAELDELNRKMPEMQTSVNELSAAYDTAANSSEQASYRAEIAMSGLDETMQATAIGVADTINGLGSNVGVALDGVNINISDLATALANAGISATDMTNLTADQFASLATRSGGDLDWLVQKIGEYAGADLPSKYATAQVDGNATQAGTADEINGTADAVDNLNSGSVTANADGNAVSGDAEKQVDSYNDSVDEMSDKTVTETADGNVISGDATKSTKNMTDAVKNLSSKGISVTADGNVISGNAATSVNNLRTAINNLSGKSVTITTNYVTNGTPATGNAAGGIRTHASGGVVRYHAGGAIVNMPGSGYPLDLVGEKGAEAIVPLTNKRYSMPFVRMIAQETVKQTSNGYDNSAVVSAVNALRADLAQFAGGLGKTISDNAPTFPSEREFGRMVRNYA